MSDNRERDRKDHYLPRGFLKGFIDPANKDLAKPLWHFDLETAEWIRESPCSIGWERGMYDYHPGNLPNTVHRPGNRNDMNLSNQILQINLLKGKDVITLPFIKN